MLQKMTIANLKILSNYHISEIFDKLQIDYIDCGNTIKSSCPCSQHGGDRSSKAFNWKKDYSTWICWSHHCEEKYGADIIGLIRSIKNNSFIESKKLLIDLLKNKDSNFTFEKLNNKKNRLFIHKPLPENQLKWLISNYKFLTDRGFSEQILKDYKIGFWSRLGTFMHDRMIIPIRDHEGFLVGYSGRTIHDKLWFESNNLEYKKWIHGRSYLNFPKEQELFTGSILFNLNNAKNFIRPYNRIILVEGPLDGLKLQMAGIKNWVCSLGTSFGPSHRSLLIKYGITDLYVAYDNDDPSKYKDNIGPGQKGFLKVQKIIGDLINISKVELPVDKDPGSMSIKEIKDRFGSIYLC